MWVLGSTFAAFILTTGCGEPSHSRAEASSSDARLGFSSRALVQERDAEAKYAAQLSTDSISQFHRVITKRPHIAGSPASMAVAETIRQGLEKAGLQTEVHEFQVYLSTPRSISAELVEPEKETLNVREPANPLDPDSANPELVPAFVAYSASGEVRAPVVYVNYGLPADYAKIEAAGVDVRGKIVMARYARSHRAVKIHTAQEHGAAAIIIYSDPADDGYAKGLTWPEGPWRADFQSQDGNGKYSWFWHGDPLSPGVGARADSRCSIRPARRRCPRIPAMVLSSKEAAKILGRLRGPGAPGGFPGCAAVYVSAGRRARGGHMNVQMDASRRPIHDIVARLRGKNPDRWVVLGTHHDAWTFGGMDPGSGTSAVYETARCSCGIGETGLDAGALHRLRLLGRRRGRAGWIHRIRRGVRATNCARRRSSTLIPICSCKAIFSAEARRPCAIFWSRWPRTCRPSADKAVFTTNGAWMPGRSSRSRGGEGPKDFEVELAALGSGADFVAFQDYLGLPTLSRAI